MERKDEIVYYLCWYNENIYRSKGKSAVYFRYNRWVLSITYDTKHLSAASFVPVTEKWLKLHGKWNNNMKKLDYEDIL